MRLEAKQVSFRYTKKSPAIFENVNFLLEEGERIALMGPSGFGKSTLAAVLAGYLRPKSGQVLLDGAALPRNGICPVQLILQHPELSVNPRWRMRRMLEEAGAVEPATLEALGIEQAWLARYPSELSGGELQRFCIARALGVQPRFLIADELSAMLDVITQAQIWNFLLEEAKRRKMGLLVITHDPALAKRVCTCMTQLPTLIPARATAGETLPIRSCSV